MSTTPATPARRYPQSHRLSGEIRPVIDALAANRQAYTSFYLDTVEGMSGSNLVESEDHHQGLARSHRLRDGSIHFFLSHSEVEPGEQGSLSWYRYGGQKQGDHIMTTSPLTVAPMKQLLMLDDRHPSDLTFLPEVDDQDAGYLFVTEEYDQHRLSVYRWSPDRGLELHGRIRQGFPSSGPNFVFIDRSGEHYYLGIASNNWGWGILHRARDCELFPSGESGRVDVAAFESLGAGRFFPFPLLDGPSQCKLVRDAHEHWYLLAYRGDPDGDPTGPDYIDAYGVSFHPFRISNRLFSVHIKLPPGQTSFTNTGTHWVERSGRLLVSSSYRWSEDEGPGESSYVSRVDECPSA
jgi:hypothetical protein